MAKKNVTKERHESERVRVWAGSSPFGSHLSMVVASDGQFSPSLTEDELKEINERWPIISAGRVVCRDELGFYLTYKDRIDSGLADPARYNGRGN